MFGVMLCHVRERHASQGIPLVEREVKSFNFRPYVASFRQVFHQSDRDLVFDTLAIRFSSRAKEQYPGFSVNTAVLFQSTALISLRHCVSPSGNRLTRKGGVTVILLYWQLATAGRRTGKRLTR